MWACLPSLVTVVITSFTPSSSSTLHWARNLGARTTRPAFAVAASKEAEVLTGATALGEAQFPRTWVPLASTFELDPDRPTPVAFLGQRYVVWQDNDGEWRVMDDACPHRLAPLSEGRVDRETNRIECAYHGWSFEPSGACAKIPQATQPVATAAQAQPRACVGSYLTQVEKSVLFFWPWPEASLTAVEQEWAHPQAMLAGVATDASTYTRDLPYGWDTLLENIVDPAHIPFAHHGLQGKRSDAIPINMTQPHEVSEAGFRFDFGDRTMGMMRQGSGAFRAPFVVAYNAEFEPKLDKAGAPLPRKTFNLTVVCVPTGPGRSRAIIFGGKRPATKAEQRAERDAAKAAGKAEGSSGRAAERPGSLAAKIFRSLPVWLVHIGSSRFLDSDLAFLHFQEQTLHHRGDDAASAYFMPTPSDRCIAALRRWLRQYASVMRPLPPPEHDRQVLFNRWTQHTAHCVHCQAAYFALGRWRTATYGVLALSLIAISHWLARVAAVACVGLLRLYALLEGQLTLGGVNGYEHWKSA